MRVGAVILTHQPPASFDATLAALAASTHAAAATVVVDNASDPQLLDRALVGHPPTMVVRRSDNAGYGAAMNDGVEALHAYDCDAYLFLTQDALVEPDTVAQLAASLDDVGIAVAGPYLYRRTTPAVAWSAGGRIAGLRRVPRHITVRASRSQTPNGGRQVEWLDGACLLVERTAFDAVGGFRADLFLYWDDVDLCRRIRQGGRSVCCLSAAVAYQEPSFVPPYLMGRNRALVLGPTGVAATLLDIVRTLLVDAARGRGSRRALLMSAGLRDARRGRLDLDLALVRP